MHCMQDKVLWIKCASRCKGHLKLSQMHIQQPSEEAKKMGWYLLLSLYYCGDMPVLLSMLSISPASLQLYRAISERFICSLFFLSVMTLLLTTGLVFVQLPSSICKMIYSNTNTQGSSCSLVPLKPLFHQRGTGSVLVYTPDFEPF